MRNMPDKCASFKNKLLDYIYQNPTDINVYEAIGILDDVREELRGSAEKSISASDAVRCIRSASHIPPREWRTSQSDD